MEVTNLHGACRIAKIFPLTELKSGHNNLLQNFTQAKADSEQRE
jgi:hypothetical protein